MVKTLACGVGVNDSQSPVTSIVNGKMVCCSFYSTWAGMIRRCYDAKSLAKNPTYSGCVVSEEWHTFSTFRNWMCKQNWKGKNIDKDFIGDGKRYSPETCVFVSQALNKFIIDSGATRGLYPIGVDLHLGRFRAKININGVQKHLGRFDTPEQAHAAWVVAKTKLANNFIEIESDQRIIDGLRRYVDSIQVANCLVGSF